MMDVKGMTNEELLTYFRRNNLGEANMAGNELLRRLDTTALEARVIEVACDELNYVPISKDDMRAVIHEVFAAIRESGADE